jgi:LemA protein
VAKLAVYMGNKNRRLTALRLARHSFFHKGETFSGKPAALRQNPRMLKVAAGCVGVILLVFVILVITAISSYNGLVASSQAVDAQWAQVQNVYQRRADLVPNLVQTVQGAANFEKSTLTEITNARASVGQVKIDPNQAPASAAQLQAFQEAQGQLSSALSRLLVVVERYPELKANANFRDLQAQLEGSENRIAVERGRFNEVAQAFNTKVKRFPVVLIAGPFGFHPKPYFQSVAGAEAPPKVNFDFGGATPAPAS